MIARAFRTDKHPWNELTFHPHRRCDLAACGGSERLGPEVTDITAGRGGVGSGAACRKKYNINGKLHGLSLAVCVQLVIFFQGTAAAAISTESMKKADRRD